MTLSAGVRMAPQRDRKDARLAALLEGRFAALMEAQPSWATSLGIHRYDGRLGDRSRSAREADMRAEADHIAALEACDPGGLSAEGAFEREVALHGARLRRFEAEVERGWERRATAAGHIGDAIFLLLVRDFAPLAERLESIASRLEAVPEALRQERARVTRPVRLWQSIESDTAAELPVLLDQVVEAARQRLPESSAALRRLERASADASDALAGYIAWLRSSMDGAGGEVALGRDELDALLALRALDGLGAGDILALGWQQLEALHAEREAAGHAIDPALSEWGALDRVKSAGPLDFEQALSAYRRAMLGARGFIADHDLVSLPGDDVIEVLATPEHMRGLTPLAAFFEPAVFDRPIRGVYIVTPSVDGDPRAMREHNWASIVNTSVHEAYPGHHLQFAAALASATPARLLVDAPEFHEGWGMYCEQMMLEAGFEDTPERRVIVATDAIWRACRIILDIQLHRGEIDVPGAVDFLVEHTGFERPVATAEVHRYTQTPGYNLSYLLGKLLILRLRADEQGRLGDGFSLRAFHDALLYSGSLPVSFQRRLLAGEGGGPTTPGTRHSWALAGPDLGAAADHGGLRLA